MGGLSKYSVYSWPSFVKVMARFVRLVTKLAKAWFGQVGTQVSQVKDQVGQGQGQELDKNQFRPENLNSIY